MKKIIGIDLGTTNSVVAVMEGSATKIIPNKEGSNITPSIIAFTKDGKRLVGILAKRQAVTNPENTIFSVKRFIGHKYSEVKHELQISPTKLLNVQMAMLVSRRRVKNIHHKRFLRPFLHSLNKRQKTILVNGNRSCYYRSCIF